MRDTVRELMDAEWVDRVMVTQARRLFHDLMGTAGGGGGGGSVEDKVESCRFDVDLAYFRFGLIMNEMTMLDKMSVSFDSCVL